MRTKATNNVRIIPRRLRGMCFMLKGGVDRVAKSTSFASRTLSVQMTRGELSAEMAEQLREVFGEEVWRFITGEVDTLRDLHDLGGEAQEQRKAALITRQRKTCPPRCKPGLRRR